MFFPEYILNPKFNNNFIASLLGDDVDCLLARYVKSGYKLDKYILQHLIQRKLISEDERNQAIFFWNQRKSIPYLLKTNFLGVSDGRTHNGHASNTKLAIENVNKRRRQSRSI